MSSIARETHSESNKDASRDGSLGQFHPLGMCIGDDAIVPNCHIEYPWRVMLSNWTRFNTRYRDDDGFKWNLSPYQSCSYQILTDWWQAFYCDKGIIRRTRAYMERLSLERLPEDPLVNDGDTLTDAALGGDSRYYRYCFELFLLEFYPEVMEAYNHDLSAATLASWRLTRLGLSRRSTVQCSIAQRMSFSSLPPAITGRMNSARPCAQYPKIALARQSRALMPSQGHPYYLWDIRNKRTVEVESLIHCPEYVCISHTWGRWVDESRPPFQIPGVPWPVPRVKRARFDVETLPQDFQNLDKGDYVWFDLFCIPQMTRNDNRWYEEEYCKRYGEEVLDHWRDRADDEIARQSSIFHGSSGCIAWLNDVEDWKTIQWSLRWMSMWFLKESGYASTRPFLRKVVRALQYTLRASESLRSCFPQGSPFKVKGRGLTHSIADVAWFTSLWTLQEAFLCPDMELYSRSWSRLTDDWGCAIRLTTLMVFADQCGNGVSRDSTGKIERQKGWPGAAIELEWLIFSSAMANVLTSDSPIAICPIAALRQCSGPAQSRAPAIMSAIGVTAWWHSRDTPIMNQFGEEEIPSQMVLDLYPLGFLQDAAHKIGAIFYHVPKHGVELNATTRLSLERQSSLGSMIPFRTPNSSNRNWVQDSVLETAHIDMVDHHSVSRWHICGDGTVKVLSAGILATSRDSDERKPIAAFMAWSIPDELRRLLRSEIKGSDTTYTPNLQLSLRMVAGRDLLFGVSLYTDGLRQFGIILFGLGSGNSDTQFLVKIGTFDTIHAELPESSVINWVIL